MIWLLSFLPRRWLQSALYEQWRATLPRDQQIRLDHWGSAGCNDNTSTHRRSTNDRHHP